jgi:hypothetical protein
VPSTKAVLLAGCQPATQASMILDRVAANRKNFMLLITKAAVLLPFYDAGGERHLHF